VAGDCERICLLGKNAAGSEHMRLRKVNAEDAILKIEFRARSCAVKADFVGGRPEENEALY
jgi:hypothetical protein